jgi:hypothetical protein
VCVCGGGGREIPTCVDATRVAINRVNAHTAATRVECISLLFRVSGVTNCKLCSYVVFFRAEVDPS